MLKNLLGLVDNVPFQGLRNATGLTTWATSAASYATKHTEWTAAEPLQHSQYLPWGAVPAKETE